MSLDAPCVIDGIEYPAPACYSENQMNSVLDPILEALSSRARLREQVERLERELAAKPDDSGLINDLTETQKKLDDATANIRSLSDEKSVLEHDLQRSNADLIGAENAAKAATGRLRSVQEKLEVSEAERARVTEQLSEISGGIADLRSEIIKRDIDIVSLKTTLAELRQGKTESGDKINVLQAQLDSELKRRVDAELKLLERELVVDDLQNRLRTNSQAIDRLRRAQRNVDKLGGGDVAARRGVTRPAPDDFEQGPARRQRVGDVAEPEGFDFSDETQQQSVEDAPPVQFSAGNTKNECPTHAKTAAEAVMLVGVEFESLQSVQSVRCLHRLLLLALRRAKGLDASRVVRETYESAGDDFAYSTTVKGLLDEYRRR